ncbi:MAG TPA: archease [Candidatus Latescibacteria bacterium]|nr:archease [Candidatus Latescibacterota bacterium]
MNYYTYFEHPADVGIEGIGATIEEAFEQAASAMFNLIVDIEKVKPQSKVQIHCQGEDVEELFIDWLNTLLAQADIHSMVFCRFKIDRLQGSYLTGYAEGEELNQEKHKIKLEVKAATYCMLEVGRGQGGYFARCVVDV